MSTSLPGWFDAVVTWQRSHGRHSLPWQQTRDPYRVWLSEIMLQQTQVVTVLGYYDRFLAAFPDVGALAAAPEEAVMALWSGLGYYSRARNLHRCAQSVMAEHDGQFPADAATLQTLPGIGPSTAAAIAAFCFGQRISILDGNVVRVLGRALAFEHDVGSARALKEMGQHAQALVRPDARHDDMRAYTQGLMDLGATLCTRHRPRCADCPVQAVCQAHASGQPTQWPIKIKKPKRTTQRWPALALWQQGRLWLEKRQADAGNRVWEGLWCWPIGADAVEVLSGTHDDSSEVLKHELSHVSLRLAISAPEVSAEAARAWTNQRLASGQAGQWVTPQEALALGLPQPLRRWLEAQDQ